MRKIKKITALMLAFLMVLTTNSTLVSVMAEELADGLDSRDKIELPYSIPEDSEVRSSHIKRLKEDENEYMAIFENEDGTKSVYTFSSPIQYRDIENNLIDYDSRLVEIKDKDKKDLGFEYQIKSSDVDILMPGDLVTDKYISLEKDKYKIEFKPLLADANNDKTKENGKTKDKYKAIKLEHEKKSKEKDFTGVEYLSADSDDIKYKYYSMNTGVKEDIVFETAPETNVLKFEIKIKNAIPILEEFGNIIFVDSETNEQIGTMSPFNMYDSFDGELAEEEIDNHFSLDIKTEIEQDKNNKNKYILTVYLDEKILYGENTVYPVIVDPTLYLNTAAKLQDTYVCENRDANYSGYTNNLTGRTSSNGRFRTYVKFIFPTTEQYSAYNVTDAKYYAYQNYTYTSAAYVDIHRVITNWNVATIRWSNGAAYDPGVNATNLVNAGYAKWYTYTLTGLVKNWIKNQFSQGEYGLPNYGFIMKVRDDLSHLYLRQWRAIENGYYKPYMLVTYAADDTYDPQNVSSLSAIEIPGEPNSENGNIEVSWDGVNDLPEWNNSGVAYYELNLYEGNSVATGTLVSDVSPAIVNHSGLTEHTHTFENIEDNKTYICTIDVYDNAGNSTDTPTTSSAVVLTDSTAPATPNITIDPTEWTNNTTPALSWSGVTDDSDIENIYLSINSGDWITTGWIGTSGTNILSESLFTNDGQHNIVMKVEDEYGNVSGDSNSVIYFKDTEAPVIEITAPQSGLIDESVVIVGDLADSTSGISNWTIEYAKGINPSPEDWRPITTESLSLPVSGATLATWDTSSLELGDYTIKLKATDYAGNITEDTVIVTRNTYATEISPVLEIVTDPVGTSQGENTRVYTDASEPEISVTYSGEDSSTLVDGVLVDGVLVDEELSSTDGITVDLTEYEEGSTHDIIVVASDSTNSYSNTTQLETSYSDGFTITLDAMLTGTQESQGDIILEADLVNGGYISQGEIQSVFIDDRDADPADTDNLISGYVYSAELVVNETKPTGTDILYYISFENGNTGTWISINPNEETKFCLDSYTIPLNSSVQVKAVLSNSTGYETETPILHDWQVIVHSLSANSADYFTVSLVATPTNVTTTADANYMILVDWEDTINGEGTTYNVYRSEDPSFATYELAASDIDQTFWYDYNLKYGTTFYYKVTAVKEINYVSRESIMSSQTAAEVVSSDELDKMLGLQDYWKYSSFRTGGGTGYINVASGNLVYTSVDSVYPGMLLAMVMRRTYNSQATTKTSLGNGWDFSYNTCLLRVYGGTNDGDMILKDGDGSLHYFESNGDGTFESPNGVFMTLTYESAQEQYKIVRKDNISYTFDKNMKLLKMSEFDRNYIAFEYDESGKLYKVINNLGDEVVFAYDPSTGLVSSMTDPAGRVFSYTYETQGSYICLKTISLASGNYTETYHYTQNTYNLRAIESPKDSDLDGTGNLTQVEYDTNNRAEKVIFPITSEYYEIDYDVNGMNRTELTNWLGHTTTYDYDPNGCLTAFTDALGNITNYSYNNKLQVVGMSYYNDVYENGTTTTQLLSLTLNYDDNNFAVGDSGEGNTGNLLSITDPEGNISYYRNYNKYNQVGEVEVPISSGVTAITQYNYEDGEGLEADTGNLLSVEVVGTNNINEYDYYTNGLLNTIVNTITDGTKTFDTVTKYTYYIDNTATHRIGWLEKIEQGPSLNDLITKIEIIEYDSQGNPIEAEDALGNVSSYNYDDLGRQTHVYLPNNGYGIKYTETEYDMNHNVISKKDITGVETNIEYDSMDRPITTTIEQTSGDIVNTFEYTTYQLDGATGVDDPKYMKVITTDALGRQGIQYYDALGRVIKKAIAKPNGVDEIVLAEYTYDNLGNVISVTDGDGMVAEAKYDASNMQVKTIVDPTGENIVNTVEYNYAGLVTSKTNGEGYTTDYEYDILGRIKTVTQYKDSNTYQTEYLYDNIQTYSNTDYVMNSIEDAKGNLKETYLDSYGHAIAEINQGDDPDGSSTPDGDKMIVERTYDAKGQVLTTTYAVGTSEEQTDYYTYDNWGQLVSIGYGEPIPLNGEIDNQTVYTYDQYGRMTNMDDRRDNPVYDPIYNNNVPEVAEVSSSWSHDTLSRIISTTQDTSAVGFTYNDANQITMITYPSELGTSTFDSTGYTYDDYGRLLSIEKDGNSQSVRTYAYTNGGKVDYMLDYLEFDTSGTNVLQTDYTYNTIGQVSNIDYYDYEPTTPVLKESYEYEYDKRGFITDEIINSTYTQDSNTITVDVVKAHEYDSLGRLMETDVTVDGGTTNTTTWTYDAVGNRLTQSSGTTNLVYNYNEFNQLLAITKNGSAYMSYDYNERGAQEKETVEKTSGDMITYFDYDAAGRLSQTTLTQEGAPEIISQTTNYYNGQGQRVRQEALGIETKYYYSGSALLYTLDGDNNTKLTENILTPGGSIIASQRFTDNANGGVDSDGYYFYNYDIRQSTTNIIGSDWELKQGYTYDEFGNTDTTTSSSFLNNVQFTGGIADSTGLQYMNSRFYDSNTGRFLTQDTYSGNAYEPMSQHLYSYCGNNPVNYVDPTGHIYYINGYIFNSNTKIDWDGYWKQRKDDNAKSIVEHAAAAVDSEMSKHEQLSEYDEIGGSDYATEQPGMDHCAAFASVMMSYAGYEMVYWKNGALTYFPKAPYGRSTDKLASYYEDADRLYDPKVDNYEPKAGDLILFYEYDENGEETYCHTGIVEAYDPETGTVYTIEANAGQDTPKRKSYDLSNLTDGKNGIGRDARFGSNGGSEYSYDTLP